MKKIYHLCLSSPDEIMFRSSEDYWRAYNCLALAAHKTESQILADSIMSNHIHVAVISPDPEGMMGQYRYPYSRYFNNKYMRSGRVGERAPYITPIEGLHRILATISYILRNPLHHGICATPFAYPHNSANVYFQTELGKNRPEELLPRKSILSHLPSRSTFPEHYQMNKNGVFTRKSVTEISQVELLYGTAKNFNFHMNRISNEQWIKEQQQDDANSDSQIITLDKIEPFSTDRQIQNMLIHEKGKSDYKKRTDLEICQEIDSIHIQKYKKESVYLLSETEKNEIGNILYRNHASVSQIKRCLNMGSRHDARKML